MAEKIAETTAAQQTEIAIRQIDSLSTLPSVAGRLFPKLAWPEFSPSALAEIIESDPALTAKIFSLMHQQGVSSADENLSVRQGLGKLPAHIIRDAIFSVKVICDFDLEAATNRITVKKDLLQHAIAVACCAKDIAEIISPKIDSQMAYSAGLLHDIGKFALEEAMTKSFARIVEEAKSQQLCSCDIEQKYLGLDHTILGKCLAQKWHFPNEITLAIWLHHNDTSTISQNIPEAKIAQIVQLADLIARQCGIGQSGSYDSANSAGQVARSLAITPEQLEQFRNNLTGAVRQKFEVLGLESPKPQENYCGTLHATAAQLAQKQTELFLENQQMQTALSHFNFIMDLLSNINSSAVPIEVAENFAVRWQKFYQTGMVCLYLAPPAGSQTIDAVVVENLSQSKVFFLNAPSGLPVIPQAISKSFAILNAYDYIDWLFEQLDMDFDANQTKLMPLISGGRAIGAIAFELRYPADIKLFEEKFCAIASAGGALLDMATGRRNQQKYAELFVRLLGQSKAVSQQPIPTYSLNTLAEMAGGAAHELNNPLAVISGRSQLLVKAETDPEKQRMLKQIQENAGEITRIIEDLMSFANPPQPRATQTNIRGMLDEAIHLTAQKQNAKPEQLKIQLDISESCKDIFVDSAQIASAVANVLSNAFESYTGQRGPIKITASSSESGDFVTLQIIDFGCGMDSQTLRKATQPFFSDKPAGRKRGMGLAHTHRLVQLNEGSFHITSQPGSGTTVTILLPCKKISG